MTTPLWTVQELSDEIEALWADLIWVGITGWKPEVPEKTRVEFARAFYVDTLSQRAALLPSVRERVRVFVPMAVRLTPEQPVSQVAVGFIHAMLRKILEYRTYKGGFCPNCISHLRMLTRFRRWPGRVWEQAGPGQREPTVGDMLAGKNVAEFLRTGET